MKTQKIYNSALLPAKASATKTVLDSPDPLITSDTSKKDVIGSSVNTRSRSISIPPKLNRTPLNLENLEDNFKEEKNLEEKYKNLLKENEFLKSQLGKMEKMMELMSDQLKDLKVLLEKKNQAPSYAEISKKINQEDKSSGKNKVKTVTVTATAKKIEKNATNGKSDESNEPHLVSVQVKHISASKWMGKKFFYLVHFNDSDYEPRWLENDQFSADSAVSLFHEKNPGCPTPDDYNDFSQWKVVQRKQRYINKKIELNKTLSKEDIEFVAKGMINTIQEPKEFKRVHFTIGNKRVLRRCSYGQKIKIISEILHSYGLSGCVVKISFIGDSVLEVYIQSSSYDLFTSRMIKNGWIITKFDFYEIPRFVENKDEKKEIVHRALVQRLAFLIANSRLINLHKCILEGLKDDTIQAIEHRVNEIIESRKGQRTAYVANNQ